MTVYINFERGRRTLEGPIDTDKQIDDRAEATPNGSFTEVFTNEDGTEAVVAYVVAGDDCQFSVHLNTPTEARAYVVMADTQTSIVVPTGTKLWIRDLS